jgi:GntR family transcriptional repressor for pyruvate dehydrogenase complex
VVKPIFYLAMWPYLLRMIMALGPLWNRGIYPYIHWHSRQAMLKAIGQATLHLDSRPALC